MIISRHEASTTKEALRDITRRHGENVFIVSNSRLGGRNVIYFASDSPTERIELMPQAVAALPDAAGQDAAAAEEAAASLPADIQTLLSGMQETIRQLTAKVEAGQSGQTTTLQSMQQMLSCQLEINSSLQAKASRQEALFHESIKLVRSLEARLAERDGVRRLLGDGGPHIVLLDSSTMGKPALAHLLKQLFGPGLDPEDCLYFQPGLSADAGPGIPVVDSEGLATRMQARIGRSSPVIFTTIRDAAACRKALPQTGTCRRHLYTRRLSQFDPDGLLRLCRSLELRSVIVDSGEDEAADRMALLRLEHAGIRSTVLPAARRAATIESRRAASGHLHGLGRFNGAAATHPRILM